MRQVASLAPSHGATPAWVCPPTHPPPPPVEVVGLEGQPRKVAKLLVGGAQAVAPAAPAALVVIVRVKLLLQVDLATLLAVLLTLTAGQSGCRRLKVLPPSPPPSLQGEEA